MKTSKCRKNFRGNKNKCRVGKRKKYVSKFVDFLEVTSPSLED